MGFLINVLQICVSKVLPMIKPVKEKAAIFKAEGAKPKTPGRKAKVRENTS